MARGEADGVDEDYRLHGPTSPALHLWHLLCSQFLRDILVRTKDPEDITPQNFMDGLAFVPAIQKFLGDVRITGHVFELVGRCADAVVIRAQAGMLDPGDLNDVLEV